MGSPITFWVILLLFILLGFPQKLKISPYCLSVTLNKLTFPDSGRMDFILLICTSKLSLEAQ